MHVDVRGLSFELTPALSQHIERSTRQALDRFAQRIDQVHVKLSDINGPRHGVDMKCQITAVIPKLGTVVIEQIHDDAYAAVDCAMGRMKRAVRRRIKRVRTSHRQQAHRHAHQAMLDLNTPMDV